MITINHLNYSYSRKKRVFDDFSLTLTPGHIHGLLGCNGVGKSTLLKLLCGALRPQSGDILIDGFNPFERRVDFLRNMMIIPEEMLLPTVSIATFARQTSPFYPKFSWDDFHRYCRELEINEQTSMSAFSMGLKKRAYIAFALACNTDYLLLDEPSNGLDIPSKSILRRLLASVATDEKTIVISTHQVRDIDTLIDNVVICDTHGLVLSAATDALCSHFVFGKTLPDEEPLYTETTPMGNISLAPNTSGRETLPNIELLFNATLQNREAINRILTHE